MCLISALAQWRGAEPPLLCWLRNKRLLSISYHILFLDPLAPVKCLLPLPGWRGRVSCVDAHTRPDSSFIHIQTEKVADVVGVCEILNGGFDQRCLRLVPRRGVVQWWANARQLGGPRWKMMWTLTGGGDFGDLLPVWGKGPETTTTTPPLPGSTAGIKG